MRTRFELEIKQDLPSTKDIISFREHYNLGMCDQSKRQYYECWMSKRYLQNAARPGSGRKLRGNSYGRCEEIRSWSFIKSAMLLRDLYPVRRSVKIIESLCQRCGDQQAQAGKVDISGEEERRQECTDG